MSIDQLPISKCMNLYGAAYTVNYALEHSKFIVRNWTFLEQVLSSK